MVEPYEGLKLIPESISQSVAFQSNWPENPIRPTFAKILNCPPRRARGGGLIFINLLLTFTQIFLQRHLSLHLHSHFPAIINSSLSPSNSSLRVFSRPGFYSTSNRRRQSWLVSAINFIRTPQSGLFHQSRAVQWAKE